MGTAPKLHKKIIGFVDKEKRGELLDVPCGKGGLSFRMKEKGFNVTAADLDQTYFEYSDMKFEQVDLNSVLPFGNEQFDLITCIEGVEHLENIYHLFRELARVLKKGGKLIVSTPNILSVFSRLRFFLTGQFDFFGGYYANENNFYTYHINPVYFPLLKLAVSRAGLEIKTIAMNRDVTENKNFLLRLFMNMCCFIAKKITAFKIQDKVLARQMNSSELLRGEILILECVRR